MSFSLEPFIHEVIVRKVNVLGIVVRQHNEVINSFFWNDCYVRRNNINSCTKSVTSLAVGMAVKEGILSIDEKPSEIFADKMPDNPQQWWLDMTLRDTLMMGSGHGKCLLPRPQRDQYEDDDWVKTCLHTPLDYAPGTHFQYNNMGPYFISVIIQDRTGQTLQDWLEPRLFKPLGIKNAQWFRSPMHYTLGMGGLHLTTEELSRVGQVCLDHGRWNDQQLVPEEYLAEATVPHIKGAFHNPPCPDFAAGYGYFFWMNDKVPGYRGFGNYGQHMIVLPQYDAVVAVTSFDPDDQGILDAVWAGVLPQFEK